MKKLVFFIFIAILGPCFSAVPTIEGLFRGAGNNDISAEGVMFSYIASRVLDENEVLPEGQIEKVFVKITSSKEKNRSLNLIQEIFHYENKKIGDRISYKYISNVGKFLKGVPAEEKRIFLSLLLSLSRNESEYISDFLKEYSPDYVDNKLSMDRERLVVLNEYKRKLLVKREVKDLEIDEEQQKKYREALAKSLFQRKKNISLVRMNKEFYWNILLSGFNARFEVNSQKLSEANYSQGEKSVKYNFNDYILFNGLHILPRDINISINELNNYAVVVNQLTHYKNFGRKELLKHLEKIKEDSTPKENSMEIDFPVIF